MIMDEIGEKGVVVKMTKYEFLGDLSRLLSQLPQEERDEAIKFYEDYFNEAGKENEEKVIEELGTPQEVAKKILQENEKEEEIPVSEAKKEKGTEVEPYIDIQTKKESDFDNGQEEKRKWYQDWDTNKIILAILLGIVIIPSVGGILLGGICGAFGIIVGIFAVGIAVLAVGFAGVLTGMSMFIGGLVSIPAGAGAGLVFAGLGLLLAGVCILILMLGTWLSFRIIPAIIRGGIRIMRNAFFPKKKIIE